jgi:hypothetical protein
MSTLRCTNLQDTSGGNSLTTAQIYNGSVKAWVQWGAASGTPSIRSSYNVSSLTDDGVGIFRMNFTTSFSDTNYVGAGNAGSNTTIGGHYECIIWTGTTSYAWIRTHWQGTQYDLDYCGALVIR